MENKKEEKVIRVSQSWLSTFLYCRRKAKLEREWTEREPKKNKLIGTAYHSGMQEFSKTRDHGKALLAAFAEIPQDLEDREEVLELLSICLEAGIEFNINHPLESITTELDIAGADLIIAPGVKVTGRIDDIFSRANKIWVKECKTSGLKSIEQYFKAYPMDIQGLIYMWAASQVIHQPIDGLCVEVCFKPNKDRDTEVVRRYFDKPEWFKEWTEEFKQQCLDVREAYQNNFFYRGYCCLTSRYGDCDFWDHCSNGQSQTVLESTHKKRERRVQVIE